MSIKNIVFEMDKVTKLKRALLRLSTPQQTSFEILVRHNKNGLSAMMKKELSRTNFL